jgi:hypothetical protein
MNAKRIQIALVILGFNSYFICNAQNEARLLQTNSDWHITSETFSNTPFWLVPNNAPVWFYPLVNGQWVWTTNMEASFDGSNGSVTDGKVDVKKLHQVQQQEYQRVMNEIDPPGIAHVSAYHTAWHGKYHWETNMAVNWWGVWAEDTNTGSRVNLKIFPTKPMIYPTNANEPKVDMAVCVGSVATNSGAGLLPTPDGKFAKLELLDAAGKTVPTRRGAALNLYQLKYDVRKNDRFINLHTPSDVDASVERTYPDTISDLEYPRANMNYPISLNGGFFEFAGFVSNGPPCQIGYIKFNDIFDIKAEGDYTLTVQPVLYRMHNEGGTFQGYLDRVDLPSVTTKVHLVPNAR